MCQYLDGATFKVHHEVHSAHEILLDWEIAVSHLFSSDFSFHRCTVGFYSKKSSKAYSMTGNGNRMNLRKLDLKSSWNHCGSVGSTFMFKNVWFTGNCTKLLDWEIAVSHCFSSDFSFRRHSHTVGPNCINPPNIRLKHSWNWLFILLPTTVWHIFWVWRKMKWSETEIPCIC